jgi:ubiquinone/menaquinone biosynthesis C-methylase UbiE
MSNTTKPHVCPWWLGYMLASPARRLLENPEKILSPFVREGMTVLEIGPGMGYFSLPLARMVGKNGRVICVDVQEKMLRSLQKRAAKAGLLERMTPILASEASFGVEGFAERIDLAFLHAVVHEVPDKGRLFEEVFRTMRPEGMVLFSEPNGHVAPGEFQKSVDLAKSKGLVEVRGVDIWRYTAVLMKKIT